MQKAKIWLLGLALTAVALPGHAVTPETGLYYDSLRQGLGYYVEVQGTTLIFVSFAYGQSSGAPLFYIASGKITRATPGQSTLFDPPVELVRENAYQFTGELYKVDAGPCITCNVMNWDTSAHAQSAGRVYLRFADVDRMYVGFQMDDGSSVGSYVRRQAFGRAGFNLKSRLLWINSEPVDIQEPMPSFMGRWVFSSLDSNSKEPLSMQFDKVVGPLVKEMGDGIPTFGTTWGSGGKYAQFVDTGTGGVLTCFEYGCGLQKDNETELVFKYWDIGTDRILAYSGGQLAEDDHHLYYRGEHLISGIRIADPIPDAPPPPSD